MSFSRRAVVEALNEYLASKKGFGLFNTDGEKRAREYLTDVNKVENDNDLIDKICWDITQKKGRGYLHTSKELRQVLRGVVSDVQAKICDKSLFYTLNEYIDFYLRVTNPDDFGKKRAEAYKESLLVFKGNDNQDELDKELVKKVYGDIIQFKGKGELGTSTKLRASLQKALCEFYKLEHIIDREVSLSVQRLAQASHGQAVGMGIYEIEARRVTEQVLAAEMQRRGFDVALHSRDERGTELSFVRK